MATPRVNPKPLVYWKEQINHITDTIKNYCEYEGTLVPRFQYRYGDKNYKNFINAFIEYANTDLLNILKIYPIEMTMSPYTLDPFSTSEFSIAFTLGPVLKLFEIWFNFRGSVYLKYRTIKDVHRTSIVVKNSTFGQNKPIIVVSSSKTLQDFPEEVYDARDNQHLAIIRKTFNSKLNALLNTMFKHLDIPKLITLQFSKKEG